MQRVVAITVVSMLLGIGAQPLERPLGSRCGKPLPLCTKDGYGPAKSLEGDLPDTLDQGCLDSVHGPNWFILDIAKGGMIKLRIEGKEGDEKHDVDYAVYGPFPNAFNAAVRCTGIGQNLGAPDPCSYRADPTEDLTIAAAVGKVYILLVSRFQGDPEKFTFTIKKTGGPGETKCPGATGDPHLAFADGGAADFRGEDLHTYAMLSAPHVSLNAKIEEAEYYIVGRIRVNGTFIDVAYHTVLTSSGKCLRVEHRSDDVDAPVRLGDDCGDDGDGVHYYGLPEGATLTVDDVIIQHAPLSDGRRTLSIQSSEWRITTTSREIRSLKDIVWVEPWVIKATGKPKRQLDVLVQALLDPMRPTAAGVVVAPHGLLGQAYDGDDITVDGKKDSFGALLRSTSKYPFREITTEAQAEGAIEGVAKDYEVSYGFSTKFTFSRFNSTQAAPPRNVSKLTGAKQMRPSRWQPSGGASGNVHESSA